MSLPARPRSTLSKRGERMARSSTTRGELLAPERNHDSMPMIDVYAAAGTFGDTHALARNLATDLMKIEEVPDIPMFRKNTAAFVHELPPAALSNVDGDSTYVPRPSPHERGCARS
jgi:hypothetical protein